MKKFFNNRLYFYSSLRDAKKSNKNLSKIILEHSSCSQLVTINKLITENPNIWEDIEQELNRICSGVNVNLPQRKTHQLTKTDKQKQQQQEQQQKQLPRRHSAPASNVQKSRTSNRLASQYQVLVTACDAFPKVHLVKEQKEQKKIYDPLKRREEKRLEFEKALKLYDMKAYPKNILFQGMRRGNVCKKCLSLDDYDSDLVQCSGFCGDYVHIECAIATNPKVNGNITKIVKCHECIDLSSPICYACKETCSTNSKLVHCSLRGCNKYYHKECLDNWLQTKFMESDKFLCPSHVCHTCVSDDPRNKHYSPAKSKLTHCIKCPTTYHIDSRCIPAGIRILTQSHHICIRHRTEKQKPKHLNWCYICGVEGKY